MSALVMVLLRVVLAAAWIVWHVRVALLISAVRRDVPKWWRIAGWFPPISPVIAWLVKKRFASVVWLLLAGAYLAVTVAS